MAKSRGTLIRLSGPPSNLAAEVALPCGSHQQAIIIIGDDQFPLRTTADANEISTLAFSMPSDTPPGELKGRVVLDEKTIDAVADVKLRPIVHFEPAAIQFKSAAGVTVKATLKATNRGNGPLAYSTGEAVTLRQSGALAQSVAAAFKQGDQDFSGRIISLGEKMAAASSHRMPVTGSMPVTNLPVGATTSITLEFAVPGELDAGTVWTGSLSVLGTRLRIGVETAR